MPLNVYLTVKAEAVLPVLAIVKTPVSAGFPSVAERLGRRAVMTGCPVRAEFFESPPARCALPYRILITGGSQGSRAVNRAVMDALKILSSDATRLRFVHQTGERDYELVREAYAAANIKKIMYNLLRKSRYQKNINKRRMSNKLIK